MKKMCVGQSDTHLNIYDNGYECRKWNQQYKIPANVLCSLHILGKVWIIHHSPSLPNSMVHCVLQSL